MTHLRFVWLLLVGKCSGNLFTLISKLFFGHVFFNKLSKFVRLNSKELLRHCEYFDYQKPRLFFKRGPIVHQQCITFELRQLCSLVRFFGTCHKFLKNTVLFNSIFFFCNWTFGSKGRFSSYILVSKLMFS